MEYVREAGAEGIEMVMWMIMRGRWAITWRKRTGLSCAGFEYAVAISF